MTGIEATPLSRPVAASDIPPAGRRFDIGTDAAERAGIAKLIGLPAIEHLEATLDVRPFGASGLAVDGKIRARLTQTCVASSEPFDSDVVAPVEIRFSPDGRDPNEEIDLADLIDPQGEDPPDLMVGGRIDLGPVVVEFLALALDPYPRKPGADFTASDDDAPPSPFAALAALKKSE